jgi:superfamily II DNA/RNA helicase
MCFPSQAPETYVHRIGRTGRFGAFGVAVSLISSPDDEAKISEITQIYGRTGATLIHEVTTFEQVYTKVRTGTNGGLWSPPFSFGRTIKP